MPLTFNRRGMLIVISAPSGCGKSTIVHSVIPRLHDVRYSISTTSRPRRGTEMEGREYHFISREEFEEQIAKGEFLEHAEVHGHLYGTPRQPIVQCIKQSLDVVLDVDVQGGVQIREKSPDAILIFVAPPSMDELENRLRSRMTESEDDIQLRLNNAVGEMKFWSYYDYVVTNENLDEAIATVENIIRAERCRSSRLRLNDKFVGE